MLIMHPLPHAFRSLKAALLMVNVPKVSMSNTAVSSVLIGLLLMHIVHLSPSLDNMQLAIAVYTLTKTMC